MGAWEKADKEIPSLPQLWAGDRIEAHLAQWRAGLVPGAQVKFVPSVRADKNAHAAAPH
ncbi:MAG: hypothetical protein ACREO3_10280 [Arenimonas sp.]